MFVVLFSHSLQRPCFGADSLKCHVTVSLFCLQAFWTEQAWIACLVHYQAMSTQPRI